MREHLEAYQRQTRMAHPMLADAPALPEGCEILWSDFLALHGSRGSSGVGPMPITFLDIDAYERVNRIKFEAWELDAIRRVDRSYFAARASA